MMRHYSLQHLSRVYRPVCSNSLGKYDSHFSIAPDKALFPIEKYRDFSYFFTKTYYIVWESLISLQWVNKSTELESWNFFALISKVNCIYISHVFNRNITELEL